LHFLLWLAYFLALAGIVFRQRGRGWISAFTESYRKESAPGDRLRFFLEPPTLRPLEHTTPITHLSEGSVQMKAISKANWGAILGAVFGLWALSGVPALAQNCSPQGGRARSRVLPGQAIVVVGEGEVTAQPDTAEVHVGVVTLAASAAEALQANNAAVEKLFKALEARQIPKKDLQTSNFGVSPEYKHGPHGQQVAEIVGYQVQNQLSVKIRQLPALGPILDELVREGANQVHGINFSVADPSRILDSAREKAIADARRKADIYAHAAGIKAGKVVRIDEEGDHAMPRPPMMAYARSAVASVPVASGERSFHVRVVVTFAID
jgi:uncharacterized protein